MNNDRDTGPDDSSFVIGQALSGRHLLDSPMETSSYQGSPRYTGTDVSGYSPRPMPRAPLRRMDHRGMSERFATPERPQTPAQPDLQPRPAAAPLVRQAPAIADIDADDDDDDINSNGLISRAGCPRGWLISEAELEAASPNWAPVSKTSKSTPKPTATSSRSSPPARPRTPPTPPSSTSPAAPGAAEGGCGAGAHAGRMAGAISACILRSLDHQHDPLHRLKDRPMPETKAPRPPGEGGTPAKRREGEGARQPAKPALQPPLPQPKAPPSRPSIDDGEQHPLHPPDRSQRHSGNQKPPAAPPAEASPGKHRRTIRRLIETTRVIAESAAVRELSSTGNRPRNPHTGNPSSSAATGKTARHSPGFIRCRLSTTTRCTNHGCQIRPLMPSQDGGSGPSQAPCQTFMIVSSVLSPIWTGGRI